MAQTHTLASMQGAMEAGVKGDKNDLMKDLREAFCWRTDWGRCDAESGEALW